jgi:hypothetical protein
MRRMRSMAGSPHIRLILLILLFPEHRPRQQPQRTLSIDEYTDRGFD